MKPTNHITHTVENGREIVGGLLSNRPLAAWLDKVEFDKIVALYGTTTWHLASNGSGSSYVRFKNPNNTDRNVYVARLIAGDFERSGVKYRDGDRLNLRQSNLYHGDGRGRCPNRVQGRNPLHAFRIAGAA